MQVLEQEVLSQSGLNHRIHYQNITVLQAGSAAEMDLPAIVTPKMHVTY